MPSVFGVLARPIVAACLLAALSVAAALAQSPATSTPTDPVLARVNGDPIRMSDVQATLESLPPAMQNTPPQQLYPAVLEHLINERALVADARRTGLDKDPAVQRQIAEAVARATAAATNQVLETALLQKQIDATVTDAALHARYDATIAGQPGAEEVHARHILVADEATAKQIIAELDKGADFAALSQKYSIDPSAKAQGGDLGWFKKTEMVPAFADAAFALQAGQITQTPVHTEFGWHVIQVIARRQAPPPTFEQARDELRQKMAEEALPKIIAQARAAENVQIMNPDGSPARATDNAEPPPNK